jgi:hypothetical protein
MRRLPGGGNQQRCWLSANAGCAGPASAGPVHHRRRSTAVVVPPSCPWLNGRADHLDLDRCVRRQPGDTDRGAGVPPVLAQHLDEQFTGSVGDL